MTLIGSTSRRASRLWRRNLIQLPSVQPRLRAAQILSSRSGITQARYQSTDAHPSVSPTSSVSSSEVSHFSKLASTWWDPHGPSRLLHLMNPLRHDFIRRCLRSSEPPPPRTLSYLDIGCGGGIFASSAARLPNTSTVTAIDPTGLVIQVAQSHQRSDPSISPPKLRYLNCAIEDLPVPDNDAEKVDILTVFEVLEHIDNPNAFLDVATQQLKPGGWIVGSTISRSRMSYLTTKLIAEAPFIGIVPQGTHDWNKYIYPRELQRYFAMRGPAAFGEFKTQGVIYIPALGWTEVDKSENLGNYFFGVQKLG